MKVMFYQCFSLTNLPSISKWDIQNITDISFMFYNCKKLDVSKITKWSINKVEEKINIFYGCHINKIYKIIPNYKINKSNEVKNINNKKTDRY